MARELLVTAFELGPWGTNCYVLRASGGRGCWIVDAGYDPEPMIDDIRELNLSPQQVVLTHAHLDHIAGLALVREAWPEVPILLHPAEQEFLTDPQLNLSGFFGEPVVAPRATGALEHGQRLELDGVAVEVRHTPGHSPGGVTLYQRESRLALVGDTLFAGGIGRYDFPTSDGALLFESIRRQLYTLPPDTRVLPGHGPETTIGRELQSNPFVRR